MLLRFSTGRRTASVGNARNALMALIAFISDFGTRDHYAACMKGVVLQINPRATLVDISHHVPPHDVLAAAFILRQAFPFFPEETVFVCVVDPGVGTARRVLAARYNNRIVVTPDNGTLTLLQRDAELAEMRVVENRRFFGSTLSTTFHGRDVLAPVAAHISKGTALHLLGPVAERIEMLQLAKPIHEPNGAIRGQVLLVDHFGNLVTNISVLDLSAARSTNRRHIVSLGDRLIGPVQTTYADAPAGEALALVGSSQMLEIAINQGNAAQTLHAQRGTPVVVASVETEPHSSARR